MKLPSSTKELLLVAAWSLVEDLSDTSVVQFDFTADRDTQPDGASWVNGAWVSGGPFTTEVNKRFVQAPVASLLVSGTGVGGTKELAVGEYAVWIRIVKGSQSVVRYVGPLELE